MSWDQIRGHATPREMLQRSLQRGRLAHTWLFTGPAGIGKKKFALAFSQSLLCQKHSDADLEYCGQCPACRQFQALSHPDFYLISCPEGKRELPIDLFLGAPEKRGREGLCHDLAQTPLAGNRKIAIIDDADLLNEAGANALLKTLEEPPGHSLIILICANRDSILPTILSRCQILRFQALSPADLTEILLSEGLAEDRSIAGQAASLADGSLTTATALLDPALCRERTEILDLLAAPLFNSVALAKRCLEGIEDAASETALQRQHADWQIRFLVEFIRDALLTLADKQHESRIPQVISWLARFDRSLPQVKTTLQITLEDLLERVMRTSEELDQNVSLPLAMETLTDDLGKLIRRIPRPVSASR